MKASLIFLLVAILGISAINCAPRSDNLYNSILSFLEHHHHKSKAKPDVAASINEVLTSFKHIIPCGDELTGFPVLEPFRVDHIDVDVNQKSLALKGSIENFVLAGLGDFLVIELSTDTKSGRTSYDILFKDIQYLGDYNLNVNANLAGYPLVVNMIGLINLQLKELRFNGAFTVDTNSVGGVLVSDVVTNVQLGDVVSLTSNDYHSVAVSNYYHKLVQDTLMLYVQTRRDAINKELSGYITNSLNTALYSVSLEDYIQQMTDLSNGWNDITCPA